MSAVRPQLILRLGANSEKEYFLKTAALLDGIIVGANFVEATPAASCSLVYKLTGLRESGVPYFIDPMTYGFGPCGPVSRTGSRLDWLKSEQKLKGGGTEIKFKRSYLRLSDGLGQFTKTAMAGDSPIRASSLQGNDGIKSFCRSVVNYQLSRIVEEFENDQEFKKYANKIPKPAAVFAPYFFIGQGSDFRVSHMAELNSLTAAALADVPVHGILCADESLLQDPGFCKDVVDYLPGSGIQALWLWFSNLSETRSPAGKLKAYSDLIARLSEKLPVYARHGGFFGLALSRLGLAGISHGIGYGEQRDVVPVIGGGVPQVRYYVPPLRKKLGALDVLEYAPRLGVNTAERFLEDVCHCAICRGVIKDSVDQLKQFGPVEDDYMPDETKREQSSAAAKMCRFHFLLNRIEERDRISKTDLKSIQTSMAESEARWSAAGVGDENCYHLAKWASILAQY